MSGIDSVVSYVIAGLYEAVDMNQERLEIILKTRAR